MFTHTLEKLVKANRPFPVRPKYAWNACVGVPLYAWLQYWSKGDYVSAKINTRIYMGLMGEIAILSTSL